MKWAPIESKASDFAEALPHRHGVHPPVPSIFTLCHANRRCQRMPTVRYARALFDHLPVAILCKPSSVRTMAPKDLLGVANIHQPGPDVSRDMVCDWVRRDLSQGIKFKFV
jgi:hypothetical protein